MSNQSLKESYSEGLIRKENKRFWVSISIVFLISFAGLGFGAYNAISLNLFSVEALLVAVVFLSGVLFWATWLRVRDRLDHYFGSILEGLRRARLGKRGEDIVFTELQKACPDSYIFKNVKLPEQNFDIDFVVVGPRGLIVVETKNLGGTFRFEGERVYKEDTHKGQKCVHEQGPWLSPFSELDRHISALKQFLVGKELDTYIRGIFVLVGGRVSTLNDPKYFVISGAARIVEIVPAITTQSLDENFQRRLWELLDPLSATSHERLTQ